MYLAIDGIAIIFFHLSFCFLDFRAISLPFFILSDFLFLLFILFLIVSVRVLKILS